MIRILHYEKEKLLDNIARCTGPVFLTLDDGSNVHLTPESEAFKLLKLMDLPTGAVSLNFANQTDFSAFVRRMV